MTKKIVVAEKNIITEEIMKDSRLFPLFCDSTKLSIQLFILEIKDNNSYERTYEIAYGLCIRTTREEISNEIFCSDFHKVYTSEDKTYSIAKISVYNYPSIIVELVNKLLLGESLKSAISDKLIDEKLFFDVFYSTCFSIRPVIFNEINTLVSRNPYEKNALISPYKDVPSFTLTVCNLDRKNIVSTGDKTDNSALLAILQYLQTETTFPFLTSSCARFGNIEFINTQCADEYEVGYVNSETIKEKIKVDYKEEFVCRKLTISIAPNIYTCSKKLLINCFFKNGEQVILDECKEVFHEEKQKLTVNFESQEQIGSISISIWKEENGTFQIWYKYAVTLLRQIGFNMGIVGLQGTVKSDWLNTIEKSNSKAQEKVAEAEKISKTSYQKPTTVGKYSLDPWVNIDRNFSKYINQINLEKSDAEFFPQGWSNETSEYGSLSFLEWFKKETQNAQRLIIQDPFYDTLGLEFLMRTTNTGTEFIVLTSTQITSVDDDKKNTKDDTEPNRAARIKSCISSNPTLCDSLKLSIYDMRSTGGGDSNLLHDRYMLIFKEDVLQKGFHLSNSIQGATKKQPLLITPIPQDVLRKVDKHLNDLINKTTIKESTFEIVPLYNFRNSTTKDENTNETDKIVNQKLYERLKQELKSDDVSKVVVENLISEVLAKNKFPEFWATFGYFLATTNCCDKIISVLKSINNPDFVIELRRYIESSITERYPLGFSEKKQIQEYDFRFLFVEDFKTIVEKVSQLSGYLSDTYGYGNWGVYYGCNLLLTINFDEYITLIKHIENQYKLNKGKDLKDAPLSKLSTILFTQLLSFLFWRNNTNNLISKLLESKIQYLKAIASSVLIADILRDKPRLIFDDSKRLLLANLSVDESLCVLIVCLLNHKFRNRHVDSVLESDILSTTFFVLRENFTSERLQYIFKQILYSYYPSIEKKFTEEILLKLEKVEQITANTIFKLWSDEFLILLDYFESARNYSGIIDMAGWSFQIIDNETRYAFIVKLNKRLKKELNEIRRPFRQDKKEWNTSFECALLIKTVLMIAILYTEDRSNCHEEIHIISEIGKFEKNYQYYKEYSTICVFSHKIEDKYKSILVQ